MFKHCLTEMGTNVTCAFKSKANRSHTEMDDALEDANETDDVPHKSFPTNVGTGDYAEQVAEMLKSQVAVNPGQLRQDLSLQATVDAITTGKPNSATNGTASGASDGGGFASVLSGGGGGSGKFSLQSDGTLAPLAPKPDTSRFTWTMEINKLVESFPVNDARRDHIAEYRDSITFMAEWYPWDEMIAFHMRVKELLVRGIKIQLNLVAIQSLFAMLFAAKRSSKQSFTSDKGGPKAPGICAFFNQKDAQTGKHKCVRQKCTFAHKCSKCKSSGHSAFACPK